MCINNVYAVQMPFRRSVLADGHGGGVLVGGFCLLAVRPWTDPLTAGKN